MVTKLLCLSIWMSIPMLAMQTTQNPEQEAPSSSSEVNNSLRVKPPKLYTGIDDRIEAIKTAAYRDGLTLARKESEEQIKALQADQRRLLEVLTSSSVMNIHLTNDLQQSREQLQMLQSNMRAVIQQFHEIIILNKSFRERPADQVALLQKALEEFKNFLK